MLESLQTVHPVFSRWYFDGFPATRRNKDPSTPLPGLDVLEAVFEENKHYKDVPREPIPELGYLFGGGNGRDDGEDLSFEVSAGAWYDGMFFPNNFDICLHWFETAEGDWANAAVLGAALSVLVNAWDADCGVVSDWDYKNPRSHPSNPANLVPFRSGSIVYLASRFADKVVPPPQVSVETVPGHGVMLYATRERFNVDNYAHIAAVDAIQDALEPIQGLVKKRLKPLPPGQLPRP
jgi:hypothetical protein